ncbi:hypothetical protein [Pontibacillus sp. HMF3514]|uniref:hypothetical protein n=1 Tax=Pontibacillus sp. HMF3514 TaxID=2692425 RepID=UPI00131FC49E|nr:hypothetical protein [Pontibacillus sp. HMF3514]QHE53333.1 hypothetical protein GS400_15500 [Pontibacillus sp. HMF3514]
MNATTIRKKLGILTLVFVMTALFTMQQSTYSINAEGTKGNEVQSHSNRADISFRKHSEDKTLLATTNTHSTKGQNLKHEDIVQLTDQFMKKLVQKTDDQNRVLEFESKNELIKSFQSITTTSLAKKYIDYYYKEYNDDLFIVPTETPPWFMQDKDYEKTVQDNGLVHVKQHNKTELYGAYTVEFTFKQMDGKWKIIEIKHS